MEEQKKRKRQPDPTRLEAFKNLPAEILETLTKKEINAFLFDEVWPDSLREKLKDYLEDGQ